MNEVQKTEPPPIRRRAFRIATISSVFIVVLLIAGIVVVGSSFVINRDVARIDTAWEAFKESRSLKTRVVTALRAEIGYGGMIHHFKNFVMRHNQRHLAAARDRLNGARGTLAQYETLGMNKVESDAIGGIRSVLVSYDKALNTASEMVARGAPAREIDRVVRVDDHPALRGLEILDAEIRRHTTVTKQTGKPSMLGAVRDALGYGGMIHQFKNYVLRQDGQRVVAARENLNEALRALQVYQSEGVEHAERAVLADIRKVLSAYAAALTTAERLAGEGSSIEEIDRIIRVDDGPALRGLALLDREIATQSENEARIVGETLARAAALTEATSLITATLTLFLTVLALWLLRARIVGPIGRLTGIVLRLAEGDATVRVDDALLGGDEIGDMGRAVQVFRQNAIRRERVEEELRLAKEEAERVNDAKSDFLSSMSHELRTPMNAILGFAQLLASDPETPLSDEQEYWVKNIHDGGEHLLALINDVLELAHIEAGRVSLSMEAVDATEVVQSCLESALALARKRGVVINDFVPDDGGLAVMADHTRLRQVLLNLLSNAVKYNRDNGQVFVEARKMANGRLRFAVSDTGAGIPEEKQRQLFEPFQRLGHEATNIEGTGIGLTITRNLVESMGGEIGFVSTEGGGSTFWVELPLAGEEDAKALLEACDDNSPESIAVERNLYVDGAKVLYVEDNPANVELMKSVITRMPGLSLDVAPNGEDGLEMVQRRKPDIILLDVNLPGIGGLEVLKRLKESESTRDIPVFAISAAAMPREVKKGEEAGFVDYLVKPINVNATINAIYKGLSLAAANEPAQAEKLEVHASG